MEIFNVTLLGEILTFMVLVWFTMKYVWPPIIQTINDRQKKIADGLEAADRGQRNLELAQQNSIQIIRQAKSKADDLLSLAEEDVVKIIEDGRQKAHEEGKRLLELARVDIEKEKLSTRNDLRKRAGKASLLIAEKIMRANMTSATNDQLVEQLISEIYRD